MTLRELAWMAEARDRAEWNHTSALLAMLVNANPFRSGRPVSAVDFNPHVAADKRGGPARRPSGGPKMSAVDLGHMLVATSGGGRKRQTDGG